MEHLQMSRFPMQRYPNGWFHMAYSEELKPGDVKPLAVFGRDLVLFRSGDGSPTLLDAHCPHLGAHLGHGGKMKDGCLVCPFHAWAFDESGRCVDVPYASKIPPKAQLKAWPVVERNGMIMAWHHIRNEPPAWEVPVIAEYDSDEWTQHTRRSWKVRSHNQEMAENSCDSAHFLYLHGTQEQPVSECVIEDHVLHMTAHTLMMTPRGEAKGEIDVHCHGFGFTTTRFKGIVETLLLSSAVTLDEEYVELHFSFLVKQLPSDMATSTVGDAFSNEVTRQVEQDIPIWENKIYIDPPMLCAGDGPIGKFRKWCKQFYSEPQSGVAALGARRAS
jgi:phenylpropionate dioxygenase-like ring-hydroxylating dioxygenase large terminal subunit